MSTKTTFKRIALVAVAALGLGVVTAVAPASAVTATRTGSIALNASSLTIVGTANSAYGIVEVTTADDQAAAAVLFSGETITARVISATAGAGVAASSVAKTDLEFAAAGGVTAATGEASSGASSWSAAGSAASAKTVATSSTTGVDMGVRRSGTAAGVANTYFFAVRTASGKNDLGSYVVRVEVLDSNSAVLTYKDITVTPVTSALDSGAKLSVSSKAVQTAGSALGLTTASYVRVGLTDANGGLIRTGSNGAPSVTVTGVDSAAVSVGSLSAADSGASNDAAGYELDGSYGVGGTISGSAATGTATITARYGAASATGSVTVNGATTSGNATTSVTADGKVATGDNFNVPLTTKSVVVKAYVATDNTGATAKTGSTIYSTVSYSGAGCNTADLSPTAGALTKNTTDAYGYVSVTVTNANPVTACSATVTFSGAGTITGGVLARTINWLAPAAATSTASTGSYQALLASTNKITWTILDQFSAPVVGKTVTFAMSGVNAPTAGVPSAITDANGQVSYSWTDAKAVADDADTISIATVAGSSTAAGGSVTITYKSALSVVASVKATYEVSSAQVLVPTLTNIGGTTGIAVSAADQIDTTKVVSGSAAAPWVKLTFTPLTSALVAVSGIPTTVTVTGAKLIGVDGKLASSTVSYGSSVVVYVLGTTTGVATVTATTGTVSAKATINFVNTVDQDERVVSATEKDGVVTIAVKDAFGNAVSGSSVDVTTSGGSLLGTGATFGSYKTSADGTVAITINGAGSVTAKLAAARKTGYLANAGDALGAVVTTGAPAGVRSVTVATNGATQATDVAQAATDAAAEATDAANAATDAANAAAEAADAATAAAQDAADAVAALSTQVSEMIDALKKQITALTNLVIKIQKKVKA